MTIPICGSRSLLMPVIACLNSFSPSRNTLAPSFAAFAVVLTSFKKFLPHRAREFFQPPRPDEI
jgi:hypothetical protein